MMIVTAAEAKKMKCPHARIACVGAGCMAWRWHDDEPQKPRAQIWEIPASSDMPDDAFEALKLAIKEHEPERSENVPKDAIWLPPLFDDYESDDDSTGEWLSGGEWKESAESLAARHEALLAARRGFCGLAGVPRLSERKATQSHD